MTFYALTRPLLRAATLISALCLALPGAHAQSKWDLPAAYPATNFHTENLVQFAADVDKLSGGKLRITVHPNASLFKAPEIKRAVQGGQAQLGEILLVNFENEWAGFGLDGIPFLATGYKDAMKLYRAQRPALEKKLGEQGMMLLYAVAWPPQGLFVKKEVGSVADMRKIKWRAYSPSTAKIAELIGAQPVTIQSAELSQALATGVVEAFITSGSTGYDSKVYEHIKYFYDLQAWLPKNAVIANRAAFNALDKPTQDALLKAAAEAEKRGWAVSEEKTDWYKKTLGERGMKILPPSQKLAGDFRQVGSIMLTDWLKKAGPDGQTVVDTYRKP